MMRTYPIPARSVRKLFTNYCARRKDIEPTGVSGLSNASSAWGVGKTRWPASRPATIWRLAASMQRVTYAQCLIPGRALDAFQADAGNIKVFSEIIEREEEGTLILAPANRVASRRVLFVNSYGGRSAWERIKQGVMPAHHLWGCVELVKLGYEVAIAEPLRHFYLCRRPFPHDLRLLRLARTWLRPGDIIYSGHTLLYWLPLLKKLGALKCHLVSLTYAREDLDFSRVHSGIIALTPAAADKARKIAPKARIAHLSWGVDLAFFPSLPYRPSWFLACGRTRRDHRTVCTAATRSGAPLRVICPTLPAELAWPENAVLFTGGRTDDTVSYQELLHQYYLHCSGSLIVLQNDAGEKTAVGFTNLIEAMAMGRPVIVTKTGALPGELDVEKAGCGLFVPPDDPEALANAMEEISVDPARAAAMGASGRALVERRFNIVRYAEDLHKLFESL